MNLLGLFCIGLSAAVQSTSGWSWSVNLDQVMHPVLQVSVDLSGDDNNAKCNEGVVKVQWMLPQSVIVDTYQLQNYKSQFIAQFDGVVDLESAVNASTANQINKLTTSIFFNSDEVDINFNIPIHMRYQPVELLLLLEQFDEVGTHFQEVHETVNIQQPSVQMQCTGNDKWHQLIEHRQAQKQFTIPVPYIKVSANGAQFIQYTTFIVAMSAAFGIIIATFTP